MIDKTKRTEEWIERHRMAVHRYDNEDDFCDACLDATPAQLLHWLCNVDGAWECVDEGIKEFGVTRCDDLKSILEYGQIIMARRIWRGPEPDYEYLSEIMGSCYEDF